MALQSETCPSCGAPVEVPENTNQTKCRYCLASLTVERNRGEIGLKVIEKVADSIESSGIKTQSVIQEGTAITQAELKRLQLSQDLSNTQLRLSSVQSEMRSLERTKLDRITKTQLRELKAQEITLKQHIIMLQDSLNPVLTSSATYQSSAGRKPVVESGEHPQAWSNLLFSFKGQIARKQFWIGFGLVCVIIFIRSLFTNTGTDPTTGLVKSEPNLIASILSLVALWIFFAVHVKRFRDRGKSGWWTAIWLVPLGFLWVIYELGFMPSKSGSVLE